MNFDHVVDTIHSARIPGTTGTRTRMKAASTPTINSSRRGAAAGGCRRGSMANSSSGSAIRRSSGSTPMPGS